MEVKIGIQSIPRELVVETDASVEEVERAVTEALSADGPSVLTLTNQKGGLFIVPADKIAFVEFGSDQSRRVGFGNIGLVLARGTTPRQCLPGDIPRILVRARWRKPPSYRALGTHLTARVTEMQRYVWYGG